VFEKYSNKNLGGKRIEEFKTKGRRKLGKSRKDHPPI